MGRRVPLCREAGQGVWYAHLSQNCPQFTVIHAGKGLHELGQTLGDGEGQGSLASRSPWDNYVRLSDPMDCSALGCSVHGIFQARVLEWVASAFSDKQIICTLKFRQSSLFDEQQNL